MGRAFWPTNVLRATAACHFSTSEAQKVARTCQFFHRRTCKCASRHSRVPCFGIWTSKSGPNPSVFLRFWLASVLRATAACYFFRHRNFQNWSGNVVFCASAACHLSFLCWTATSAPAALASLLFEHQEPRIIKRTQRFATFLTFGTCVSSF